MLGFGNERLQNGDEGAPAGGATDQPLSYRPDAALQILGDASIEEVGLRQLTPEERRTRGF